MLLISNQPLALILINAEITYNKKTLVAIKVTNKSLPASKTAQTPSLFKIIKQRNKENNRLRHKLAY
jgi:hypothetical protein